MLDFQRFADPATTPTGLEFVEAPTARISISFDIDENGNIANANNPDSLITGKKTFSISPSGSSATPDELWFGSNSVANFGYGIIRAIYFLSGQIGETAYPKNTDTWKRTITEETAQAESPSPEPTPPAPEPTP